MSVGKIDRLLISEVDTSPYSISRETWITLKNEEPSPPPPPPPPPPSPLYYYHHLSWWILVMGATSGLVEIRKE
ncbi:hypothetical protein HZH66_007755 [Vespula vulgaris]|uniref:Uncharacterized protein n=1 Tax=Vespula vulgaris TaxID=7454 RepID=A0A834JUE4_VESVU|nr:hypothetical protein HZH66_007755 [Vespula vulgaris]